LTNSFAKVTEIRKRLYLIHLTIQGKLGLLSLKISDKKEKYITRGGGGGGKVQKMSCFN
jgi:hypothetical protein